jgi:hypothetical protein
MKTPFNVFLEKLEHNSQADLARLAGVSPQHINDVLHHRRNMRDPLLNWLGYERVTIFRRLRKPTP